MRGGGERLKVRLGGLREWMDGIVVGVVRMTGRVVREA